MKRILTLLLLLTLAAATALAQRSTATVSGYITDETSGETLLGAGVLLDNGSRAPSPTSTATIPSPSPGERPPCSTVM